MKDKRDSDTLDWVDEQRLREELEHARRQARKDKQRERTSIETTPKDRGRTKAKSSD